MLEAVPLPLAVADAVVMAAAVADFRPVDAAGSKDQEGKADSPDRAGATTGHSGHSGTNKLRDQVLIGFAAETQNLAQTQPPNSQRKNADFIVANDVSAQGGFAHDTNAVTIYGASWVGVRTAPTKQGRSGRRRL